LNGQAKESLDCWITGLLDYWIAGLLDCWIVALPPLAMAGEVPLPPRHRGASHLSGSLVSTEARI
jgi:hypothetical protein